MKKNTQRKFDLFDTSLQLAKAYVSETILLFALQLSYKKMVLQVGPGIMCLALTSFSEILPEPRHWHCAVLLFVDGMGEGFAISPCPFKRVFDHGFCVEVCLFKLKRSDIFHSFLCLARFAPPPFDSGLHMLEGTRL